MASPTNWTIPRVWAVSLGFGSLALLGLTVLVSLDERLAASGPGNAMAIAIPIGFSALGCSAIFVVLMCFRKARTKISVALLAALLMSLASLLAFV